MGLIDSQKVMGTSTYISTNITEEQLRFLKLLDQFEIDYFNLDQIAGQLGTSFGNLNEILENLVHKELLHRLERGKYMRSTFSDAYVIGTFLVKNSAIAYWSALNIHGLTDQFPSTVFVQTTHRKKAKSIFGVKYQFVSIHPRKRAGLTFFGHGNYRYQITDVEKTLFDCFDLAQYSGGFDVLVNALAAAPINPEKMIEYAEIIGNIAAIKRVGFLLELMNREAMKPFIEYAKGVINEKYSLIDSGGPAKGEFVAEWKLRLNVSEENIHGILKEIY